MIPDADRSLGRFLAAEVVGDAPVRVSFDAPNRPWIQQLRVPTVNCFLSDVRENASRRDVMHERVRCAGATVGRVAPPRWFDLHYAVTVWGLPTALEHHVVASVLAAASGHDVLPAQHVVGGLADLGRPLFLTVAAGMKRPMLQVVSGDLKVSVELTLTLPIPSYVELPRPRPVERPLLMALVDGERRETRQLPASVRDLAAEDSRSTEAPSPTVESAGVRDRRLLASALADLAARARAAREQAAQGQAAQGQAAQGQPAPGQPAQADKSETAHAQPASSPSAAAGQGAPQRLAVLLAQAAQAQAALAQTQAQVAGQLAAATSAAASPGTAAPTNPAAAPADSTAKPREPTADPATS